MAQAQTGVTEFQESMEALEHNFSLHWVLREVRLCYEDEAESGAKRISGLPPASIQPGEQHFDGRDSAQLKNQNSLPEFPARIP